jgi:hypothetical protein
MVFRRIPLNDTEAFLFIGGFVARFHGLYLPAELLEKTEINLAEKVMFAEITDLDKSESGCFATNGYFAKLMGYTERQVQNILAKLKKMKYIDILRGEPGTDNFKESGRIIKSNMRVVLTRDEIISWEGENFSKNRGENFSNSLPIIEKRIKEDNADNLKYLPLSEYLKERILKEAPEAIIKESQIKSWCHDFNLMVEKDKRTEEQIRQKIDAVFSDDFWCRNIRSASKLRLRWNEGKLSHLNVIQVRQRNTEEEFIDEPRAYDMPQR